MIINSFKGIENTASPRDISDSALQDAINVDINNVGGLVRRRGFQQALTIPISTAYTTLDRITYIVSEGILYRVESDLSLTNIAPTVATEFCDFSRALFTNDGLSVFQESVKNLKIPTPGSSPAITLNPSPSGQEAGLYNVIFTYSNSDGLEGGASLVETFEVTTPSEIIVTPDQLSGYTTNVYMTEAGGEVFYDIKYGNQIAPPQINSAPIPEGADKIEVYDSKLWVSTRYFDYSIVWFSKPFHYHLFNYDTDFVVIPGKVEVLKAVPAGIIIATAEEIYAYSDDTGLEKLANYGVVPGRPAIKIQGRPGTEIPNDYLLLHTTRGVCSAFPFTPLTEERVSLPMGTNCSTAMVYNNGIQRYVALHDAGGTAFNQFKFT
jgi:hypothetical protein